MAFDISGIINKPNIELSNVRNTTAEFTESISKIKGDVGQVKGAVQSTVRQYEITKNQIKSGVDDLKTLVGIKNTTEEFEKSKNSIKVSDQSVDKELDLEMFQDKKRDITTTIDSGLEFILRNEDLSSYIKSLPKSSSDKHLGIDKALSVLRDRGLSKTNRFRVELSLPRVFRIAKSSFTNSRFEHPNFAKTTIDEQLLNLTIEGFALPGINFDTQFTNYGGFKTQIATGYNVDDVPMNMRCSADMIQKNFFDQWVACVYNFENGGFRFFDDYASTVKVYQLNELDEDVYGIVLQGAYPKSVTSLDFNTADQGMYHRLSIQWTYERYMPLKIG